MIPRRLAVARPALQSLLRSPAPRAASTLAEATKNINAPYDGRNLDTSMDPSMVSVPEIAQIERIGLIVVN